MFPCTAGVDLFPCCVVIYGIVSWNLKRHNNTVDFIITHEAPGVVLHRLGLPQNEVSNKLWELYDHTAFGMWYCGHHHIDTQYGKVRLLYDDIERIDNLESYQLSR